MPLSGLSGPSLGLKLPVALDKQSEKGDTKKSLAKGGERVKKIWNKVILGTIYLNIFLLAFPRIINAEEETPKPIQIPPPPGGFSDITDAISNIMKLVFIIAVVLLLFYFIWGGMKWLTSGGDKAQTEAARSHLTAAIIGFAIVALAYAIVRFIGSFFGIDIFGKWEVPTPPPTP